MKRALQNLEAYARPENGVSGNAQLSFGHRKGIVWRGAQIRYDMILALSSAACHLLYWKCIFCALI